MFILFSEKCNAKTIKLEKGESCHINLSSKSKMMKCKSNIIKVGKKGKITALKKGKCVVKIKKGKRTVKYKIIVRNKNQSANNNSENVPQPTFIPQPVETNTVNTNDGESSNNADRDIPKPGGIIQVRDLSIESITLKTDDISVVRLKIMETPVLGDGINYIEMEVNNTKLEGFSVGDEVYTYVNFKSDTLEKNGDVCRITGKDTTRGLYKNK